MRIVYHPKVHSDLSAIMGYYEEVATAALADEFYREFKLAVKDAAQRPERGRRAALPGAPCDQPFHRQSDRQADRGRQRIARARLHIVLSRDLVFGQADVVGTQLEEVVE